jgi:outer membrane protein OmpA-like peptidoglycan-associated protein
MRGRWLLLTVVVAAVLSCGAREGQAAGECKGQSPGVPGPAYVYFAVGSAKLDAAAKAEVKDVAGRVKAMYIRTVCLLGSADKQGNAEANFKLSVRRAEAVAAALEREGVDADVITVVGKGETFGDSIKLFEDNQQDRSVKITLTK